MPGARVASGECVTLRTVEREDVPFFSRSVTNPELRLPAGNTVVNQTQLESGVENDFGDDTPMVVCIDGDDAGPGPAAEADVQRIGGVSVTDEAPFRPELGVFVVPEYQGEGYGTEAVSLLIDYVFQVYHHPAVGSWTSPPTRPLVGCWSRWGSARKAASATTCTGTASTATGSSTASAARSGTTATDCVRDPPCSI